MGATGGEQDGLSPADEMMSEYNEYNSTGQILKNDDRSSRAQQLHAHAAGADPGTHQVFSAGHKLHIQRRAVCRNTAAYDSGHLVPRWACGVLSEAFSCYC